MASRLGVLQSDIHYCYQCFDWVVGEEWEPHCQAHLAALTSKQCGTVTHCYTLIRPAYCPFCLGLKLPASQRLKSWSRDHKLWGHIAEEHLVDCRWPLTCPYPLCDVPLKDATAFQCHLVDDHGFSRIRPVKPANLMSLDSQGEKMSLDEEAQSTLPSRKRKSSSCTRALEWMPPQSFGDTPASPGEPSLCHPRKRLRHIPPAISPTVLSLDEGLLDDQTAYNVTDSVMLSPPYTLSIEDSDKCTDLDGDLFPSRFPTPSDAVDSLKPEDINDDALFDQYLRSPSPPPSPDRAASGLSGATLIDAGRDPSRGSPESYTETLRSPAPEMTPEREMARDQDNPCRTANGPRIQLRISQPKITIRLKL